MFVRVKVGIEKKNYLLTTKIRVFPELKTYTVIEENSKKRATEYVIDDLCVCVCVSLIHIRWHRSFPKRGYSTERRF